jgi:hypothetical protein
VLAVSGKFFVNRVHSPLPWLLITWHIFRLKQLYFHFIVIGSRNKKSYL